MWGKACAINTTLVCAITLMLWLPGVAFATFGWGNEDIILDFGTTVEDGERAVLLNHLESGDPPFDLELTWRLDHNNCLLLAIAQKKDGTTLQEQVISDDGLFEGNPAHAQLTQIASILLQAKPGQTCTIEVSRDEFIVLAKLGRAPVVREPSGTPPLGHTVIVMRATSFFTPSTVTIRRGEKVVWIYADGAHEPHSVTSGDCQDLNCSGGGKDFNSGPTLTKPGHRFEHVFTDAGTYPYHCILHLGSMQGIVIVKP